MSATSCVPCKGYEPWPELIESPNQHFPGLCSGPLRQIHSVQ